VRSPADAGGAAEGSRGRRRFGVIKIGGREVAGGFGVIKIGGREAGGGFGVIKIGGREVGFR
jgi:hypothetical protein